VLEITPERQKKIVLVAKEIVDLLTVKHHCNVMESWAILETLQSTLMSVAEIERVETVSINKQHPQA